MLYRSLFLLSVAVAVASTLCVFSTEAFTAISSRRGATVTKIQTVTRQQSSAGTRYLSSPSCTSLNLFPFSRKKNGLKRRLSDDNNDEEEEEDNNEDEEENSVASSRRPKTKVDDLVQLVSLRMRRVSFFSWWAQCILTVISSVTLIFTRNVLNIETTPVIGMGAAVATNRALLPNYFLAGSSIALSFGSIFWTWATRRLSRRLLRKPTTRIQAANMLRKSITVGTCLNLMGMALAIFGAEQIVGGLAIKVLTTSTSGAATFFQGAQAANLLQPLDILVVQANTNTLFSHFCSIVAYLFLGRSIGQLDPPSVENDERPRA